MTTKGDVYIYSTLTSPQRYVDWAIKGKGAPNAVIKDVVINGNANVVNKKHLITPKGAVTMVSSNQLEFLKKIDAFNKHVKAGYIKVETKSENPDVVAKDMSPKDISAPKTPDDYASEGKPNPVLNKKAG